MHSQASLTLHGMKFVLAMPQNWHAKWCHSSGTKWKWCIVRPLKQAWHWHWRTTNGLRHIMQFGNFVTMCVRMCGDARRVK